MQSRIESCWFLFPVLLCSLVSGFQHQIMAAEAQRPDPVSRVLKLLEDCPSPREVEPRAVEERERVMTVLQAINGYPTRVIRAAVKRYLAPHPYDSLHNSKVFLLNRYIFSVPEKEPKELKEVLSIHSFGIESSIPSNYMRPLAFDQQGWIIFEGSFLSEIGPPYLALYEFDAFERRFGRRRTGQRASALGEKRDRFWYARALSRLRVTDERSEDSYRDPEASRSAVVLELVGPPDDILTVSDTPEPVPSTEFWRFPQIGEGEQLWRYGTSGHGAFPTLGEVSIDPQGYVNRVTGFLPPHPEIRRLPESMIRRSLEVIDSAQDPLRGCAEWWNPARGLRVAAYLHRLGREKAFILLREYIRLNNTLLTRDTVTPAPSRLFTPLELLHSTGSEIESGPETILIVEGIPLAGIGVYGGYKLQAFDLEELREYGRRTWRRSPVVPAANPVDTIEKYLPQLTRDASSSDHARLIEANLKAQVMNMLADSPDFRQVIRRLRRGKEWPRRAETLEQWEALRVVTARYELRWSPTRETYVVTDRREAPPPAGEPKHEEQRRLPARQ